MMAYHLGWEDANGDPSEEAGKAVRPSLCLLACEATGGDWRKALPAAAAVELVHNFSLVHDDIQDRDVLRHGRPTVWKLWGTAQAINAGDALLVLARGALLRLVGEGIAERIVLRAAQILDERTLEMVEGQVLDIEFERSVSVDSAAYLSMVEKKTGALFGCALEVGALIGGEREDVVDELGRCGRLLGSAFQIRDDMLGVWGTENHTGKQPGADIRRRKKSLPVVYALAISEGKAGDELRRVYAKDELSHEDVSFVLRCLDDVGAQAYCARTAEERAHAALVKLDHAGLDGEAVAELRQTAVFLLKRDF